jgi:predicted nucleotidyltransferase
MDQPETRDLAENVVATLRKHEPELRAAGICRLSVFGSVARGDAAPGSDVDLAAELDPDACVDLFRLTALQRRIAELLGRPVDLLPEPVENSRLRVNIDRDRRLAF